MRTTQDLSAMRVYGTTMRSGCAKQRPLNYGSVTMSILCDGYAVTEPFNTMSEASMFMQRMVSDCKRTQELRVCTKANTKDADKYVYYKTTLSDVRTNKPYCIITIF